MNETQELWPDVPPPMDVTKELAYHRMELEELRSVFSEGEPDEEERALGRFMIAAVEAQIRDLEAISCNEARPDAVIG